MEKVIHVISVFAVISGMLSAYFWHRASKVFVLPMEKRNGRLEVIEFHGNEHHWFSSVYENIEKSGKLNKKAACWTAAAVVLSAISSWH